MCIRFDGAPVPGTSKLRWLPKPGALGFQAGLQLVNIPAFSARWLVPLPRTHSGE
jgi:hypothetical protein